jgi:hypothetical protein
MKFTMKFEEITVSKILIQRHIGLSTLSNHGGIEFLYSQNGHKVLRVSDFEKLKLTQQFRYPYLDLDKRFGNVSESSKKIGILTSMNAQTLPLEFIVRNSKRIQMKGHAKQPHPQWLQSPAGLARAISSLLQQPQSARNCLPLFMSVIAVLAIATTAHAKEVKVTPVSPFGFASNAFCLRSNANAPVTIAPSRNKPGVHPRLGVSPVEAPQAPRLGIHHLFFRTHGVSPAQVLPVLNHRDDVA